MVAVIVVASMLVFGVLSIVPGDPAVLILGQNATPEGIRALHEQLGLNQPLWKQYLDFVGGVLRGDLGRSYYLNQEVTQEIASAFPVTAVLSTISMALSVAVGVSLGTIAALRANTWVDNVLRVTLLSATSVPVYALGLILIYVFSVHFQILPSIGWDTPQNVVLPAVTLATFPLALIGRMARANMLDVISQEYVTTARAKGLPERLIVIRHELRNASIPLVTVISVQFGVLLAGAVLTETIFSIPGMGQLLINAIYARDYPTIRGIVLLAAVVVTVINFIVDLLYLAIDPRMHYQ